MADKKISQLTAATTPLAGTEVLPIVQSSTTEKVSVSNLTAGRAIDGLNFNATGAAGTTNRAFYASGTTTAAAFSSFRNTSAGLLLGIESSAGQSLFSGTSAYASVIGTDVNKPIQIATNNTATYEFTTDGNLKPIAAAKGINFTANTPAAGMTSQLLNWYEEGTWTPNQGVGLTVVGTFGSSGTYTRVGRMITVRGQVTGTTSVAVAASSLICTNLPYAAAAGQSCVGGAVNNTVSASSTIVAANATLYAVQAIGATTQIGFSVTYQV